MSKKEIDYSEQFYNIIKKEGFNMTWDEMLSKMKVKDELRSDFLVACIVNGYLKICKEKGEVPHTSFIIKNKEDTIKFKSVFSGLDRVICNMRKKSKFYKRLCKILKWD